MRFQTSRRRRGMTLVETVISMGLLCFAGLGMIAAIIFSRQMLEINKQTLTAMNFCRQMLEAAATNSSVDATSNMVILRFSDPGLNVPATVELKYYPITTATTTTSGTVTLAGVVRWNDAKTYAIAGEPMYARCVVSWSSLGSTGRRRSVTMSTIVRAGTL